MKDRFMEWLSDNLRYLILLAAILLGVGIGLIGIRVYRSLSGESNSPANQTESMNTGEETKQTETKPEVVPETEPPVIQILPADPNEKMPEDTEAETVAAETETTSAGVETADAETEAAAMTEYAAPETETEGQTETEVVTEAQTEVETEAVTEAQTEVETEVVTEAQTEVETEAQTETETETETEAQTEVETEAVTEAQTETETETETEAQTEVETEAVTEAQTETEVETEGQTEAVTEVETETETETEEATESVTEAAEEETEAVTEETETETETETEDIMLTARPVNPNKVYPTIDVPTLEELQKMSEENEAEKETEESDTFQSMGRTIMYTSAPCNVRMGPGTEFDVIANADQGEEIIVNGETSSWYRVYYDKKIAFIHKSMIVEEYTPTYMTMTGTCYMRSESDYGDNIIGEYYAGTTVELLQDLGGWVKVKVDGQVGYMGARFFR